MTSAPYTPPPTKNVRPDEQVWLGKVGNDLELALAEIVYRLDSELTDAKARSRTLEEVTVPLLTKRIERLRATLDQLQEWLNRGAVITASGPRALVVLDETIVGLHIRYYRPLETATPADCFDFAHVFELVDVTDEERYFTHGIFLTEQEAKEAATCARPPCGTDSSFTGGVTYEIRKRRVGFHPHEIGEVVLTREWISAYDEQLQRDGWTVKDTVPSGKPVSTQ